MRITTWNINSIRSRMGIVERFLQEVQPDILCLQEIKCLNDQFPSKLFTKLGYEHQAINGQKAYHGVATVARAPFVKTSIHDFCGRGDARHISVTLENGTILHNFYVPAGGDDPDPITNDKFAHKLAFVDEMAQFFSRKSKQSHIIVGDLNIAPLEHDVWSHKQLLKVVSHTPVEVEKLQLLMKKGKFVDVMRRLVPEDEKLYTWWSYRAKDWRASNRGRRLDHIWVTPPLEARAVAGGRPALHIHDGARDWVKPSDHAPVTLDFGPA
ncbi:MAG: exodeoxyribonuclease III [Pseudomonadota bacterium]